MSARADFILTGAARLVTCAAGIGDGPLGVVENGALAAADGVVVWVGREKDLRDEVDAPDDARTFDARGKAVLPGLVDCHTHLVFAGDRAEQFAARARGEPYVAGGVRSTVNATRAATSEELTRLALARLDAFAIHGVTTVEAKSGYGLTSSHEMRLLDVAARLKHPVDVVRTYMGAHVVPEDADADAYVGQVCEDLATLGNLAEFVDVWVDRGAFSVEQARVILRAARAAGYGLKVHAEQLAHTGGASLAAEFGAVSCDHLEHADEDDADALARARTTAVLLPGASMMTGARFAPARMLIERGVRVALSTDFNPGTSYTENLQLMVALGVAQLKMTVEEAILGVTRHAAAALARENKIGVLRPGAQADVLVLEASSEIDLAYHYGADLTSTLLKRAKPVPLGR
jgi:imidazolonepropionase